MSQSQEKGTQGKGGTSQASGKGLVKSVEGSGEGRAMRAVDDTVERKRRRRDAQQSDGRGRSRGNTCESAETRMPGHFSPTGESETVEALIVPEPQAAPCPI